MDRITNEMQIQVALQEYSTLWEYYRFTVAQRVQVFDWYLKAMVLPASAIGLTSGLFQVLPQRDSFDNELTLQCFGLLLCAIGIAGIWMFVYYANETANSYGYLNAISKLRECFRGNCRLIEEYLIHATGPHHQSKFNANPAGMSRAMSFGSINSMVLAGSFALVFGIESLLLPIVAFVLLVGLHWYLFFWLTRKPLGVD
ncbi:MAG TPA: hypothetical protein VGM19_03445 [Armatimonadota bacterium]|jgi:hypothetical protein